jgi:N-acetylmuramoyl-L-alanine amidase
VILFIRSLIISIIYCVLLSTYAYTAEPVVPIIVIDPGHTSKHPGAISLRGIPEVDYNDNFVRKLADKLSQHGVKVLKTRKEGEEIDLDARIEKLRGKGGTALISIHHDSAQLVHLKEMEIKGKRVYQTIKPISGYSIFISRLNPYYRDSLRLAMNLGEEILRLGRNPTLHHAEPIAGENRTLIDKRLGIYQFDDLKILSKTTIPAVLLEVGVLVDKSDEAYVSNENNQDALIDAIVRAFDGYFAQPRKKIK